jgi:hypothetical protein
VLGASVGRGAGWPHPVETKARPARSESDVPRVILQKLAVTDEQRKSRRHALDEHVTRPSIPPIPLA